MGRYDIKRILIFIILAPVWVPVFIFFWLILPSQEIDEWSQEEDLRRD